MICAKTLQIQSLSAFFGLCILIGSASVAPARGRDFDPASDAWNGLGYLLKTAREAQVVVRVSDTLIWDDIAADEVLFVVAPHVGPGLNGTALRQFVRAGGRLVLADDFRAGDQWLRPFGLELLAGPGPVERYAAGVRHLPELQGGTELGAFLGYHVDSVVLNHPAALVARPTRGLQYRALGRFGDGVRAWAMEAWRPGEQGRVLGVSDPSLLINTMTRRFYGNKQVSANLLRYFCFEGEPCRIRLLANLTKASGNFTAGRARASSHVDVRRILRRSMDTLADLAARRALRPLWWLLVLLALAMPVVRSAQLPAARLPPPVPGRNNVGRLRHAISAWLARPEADYRRPAKQLARHVSRIVSRAETQLRADQPATDRSELPLASAIAHLVAEGHLADTSAQRIVALVGVLEEVAERVADPVDRERFTQLAAEVDWAEQVLSHTTMPRRSP